MKIPNAKSAEETQEQLESSYEKVQEEDEAKDQNPMDAWGRVK